MATGSSVLRNRKLLSAHAHHSPLAFVCSSVAAQVTSPQGLGTTEGSTVFFHWGENRRFQQIDYTQNGAVQLISSISWRRDGKLFISNLVAHLRSPDRPRPRRLRGDRQPDQQLHSGHTDDGVQHSGQLPDWSTAAGTPSPAVRSGRDVDQPVHLHRDRLAGDRLQPYEQHIRTPRSVRPPALRRFDLHWSPARR